jgi:hypothetical protein
LADLLETEGKAPPTSNVVVVAVVFVVIVFKTLEIYNEISLKLFSFSNFTALPFTEKNFRKIIEIKLNLLNIML